MNRKMFGMVGTFAAIAIMSQDESIPTVSKLVDTDKDKEYKPKPEKQKFISHPIRPAAGCKQYFFNSNGGYNTVRDEYTVFECVALNFKSVTKKYNNYLKSK